MAVLVENEMICIPDRCGDSEKVGGKSAGGVGGQVALVNAREEGLAGLVRRSSSSSGST